MLELKPTADSRAAQLDKICARVLIAVPLLGLSGWLLFKAFTFVHAMHVILAVPTALAAGIAALAFFVLGTWMMIYATVALDPTEHGTRWNDAVGLLFSATFVFALVGLFFAEAQAVSTRLEKEAIATAE